MSVHHSKSVKFSPTKFYIISIHRHSKAMCSIVMCSLFVHLIALCSFIMELVLHRRKHVLEQGWTFYFFFESFSLPFLGALAYFSKSLFHGLSLNPLLLMGGPCIISICLSSIFSIRVMKEALTRVSWDYGKHSD